MGIEYVKANPQSFFPAGNSRRNDRPHIKTFLLKNHGGMSDLPVSRDNARLNCGGAIGAIG